MPPGYGTALPNGTPSPMLAAAPIPPPQPQAPPLTASERAAIAIEKVAREVGELESQVNPLLISSDLARLTSFSLNPRFNARKTLHLHTWIILA